MTSRPTECDSPHRDELSTMNQRPFTASGARKTRLLAVHAHCGENVMPSADGDSPSSYVALSIAKSASEDRTAATPVARLRVHAADAVPSDEAGEIYDLRSSPFATSRVVERSAYPMWNELLLLPVPIEWRAATDAQDLALVVDIVQRDSSQQEDSLLASASVPLLQLPTNGEPQLIMLEFGDSAAATATSSRPPLRVFLTATELTHIDTPGEVLEVVIQSFAPVNPEVSVHGDILTVMLSLGELAQESATTLSPRLRNTFRIVRDGDIHSRATAANAAVAALSPTAHGRDRQFHWHFPVVFQLPSPSATQTRVVDSLVATLFSTSQESATADSSAIARGQLDLTSVPDNGVAVELACPLQVTEGSAVHAELGQLALRVRRWNAQAWEEFQCSSYGRRIITTNRRTRKKVELQALGWTGAFCRGLNRNPISSFRDEGGLTSVLAAYLVVSSDEHAGHPSDPSQSTVDPAATAAASSLLNEHARLLQQEVVLKQQMIHQLQAEADSRLAALRTCGAELMATRKEVRVRDDQIAHLQGKLTALEQREAEQTRDLLAMSQSSLRLDGPAAQRMSLLISKFKELEQKHCESEAALDDAKRSLAVLGNLERKYAELEVAHVVQAALVQRLQNDRAQTSELQRVVRVQEKVIQKFEKTVALQRPAHHPIMNQGRAQMPKPTRNPVHEEELAETGTSMLSVRVHVLEEQLRANAKTAANEVSRLKMRILELETQQSQNFASDQPQR